MRFRTPQYIGAPIRRDEQRRHPGTHGRVNAADGVDTVFARDPDCMILDIRMPGLTGPDLRDRLQELGRSIPVVFITAHPEDVVSERSLTADAADVLRKPFGDRELLDAISRAVRQPGPDSPPLEQTRDIGPKAHSRNPSDVS